MPPNSEHYIEKIIVALENGLNATVDREKFKIQIKHYEDIHITRWIVKSQRKALFIKRSFLIYLKDENIPNIHIIIDGIKISHIDLFLKYIGIGIGFGGIASGVMAIVSYAFPI